MAIRIRSNIQLSAFEDVSEQKPLFGSKTRSDELIIPNMDRLVSGRLSIAVSGTESLPLGDVAVPRGVYLLMDGAANLVLNGGTETFNLLPASSGTTSAVGVPTQARFFFEGSLTAVSITNPSATVVLTGTYVVYGDPV